MKKLYFKTAEALELASIDRIEAGFTIRQESTGVKCACGQSFGYSVFDDDFNRVELLILCEACYNEAPAMERGE